MGGLVSTVGFAIVALGVIVLFRRLPQLHLTTRGHALALIAGGLFVVGVGARLPGGSAQTADTAVSHTQSSAPTPLSTPTRTPTPTPVATPTGDPHALTAANIKRSIMDNKELEGNTSWDGLSTEVRAGGQLIVVVKPQSVLDEQYFITVCAEDTLVVAQSVKGWYQGVSLIHMQCDSDFTDVYGKTTTEPGAWLDFTAANFNKMNPSAMTTSIFAQPSNLFAIADAYYIHPAIWKKISSDHRGALVDFESGDSLVSPLPN